MPWPRSERGSPVPKPKVRSPLLPGALWASPRSSTCSCDRGGLRATHACHSGLRALYLSNGCGGLPDGRGQGVRQCTNVYGHRRLGIRGGGGGCLPFSRSGRSFLFCRGTRMRLRAFGLGTGLPHSDLGQGTWVRVRDLTRVFIYPSRYLYIPRGIYISRAVFINPQRYLYIPRGIYKSLAVFIYPARYLIYPPRYLYIPSGI